MGAVLTHIERQQIREKCANLSLQGLEKLAVYLAGGGQVEGAKLVREIIAQRRHEARAKAVPLEVAGQPAPSRKERPAVVEISPLLSSKAKHALAFVGVTGAGALGVAYVVIPAAIALGQAVAAFVTLAAPYVAAALGVALAGVLLLSGRGEGEKKTGSAQGGDVYHIYAGPGQVHVHQSGEK